jgi:hypothetical protein
MGHTGQRALIVEILSLPAFAAGRLSKTIRPRCRLRKALRGYPDKPVRGQAAEGRLAARCPELTVGFPVPRPPAEVVGGTAADVLDGHARQS